MATIQETKLTPHNSKTPKFPNYTSLRQDRPAANGGGGLLTLIRQDVPFKHIIPAGLDTHSELDSIKVLANNKTYTIHNIYIPPPNGCTPNFTPNLSGLNSTNHTLITGDLNAHNPLWLNTQGSDARGTMIIDELEDMVILNNPECPTRKPFRADQAATSPDLSICSPDLLTELSWRTEHDLSSDHLPIIISLTLTHKLLNPPKKTHINYKRANWLNYTEELEEALRFHPVFTTLDATLKYFNNSITSVETIYSSRKHQAPKSKFHS